MARSGFLGQPITDDEHIVRHEFADPAISCCGRLVAILRGDEADLLYNECGVIVRAVPAAEAEKELSRMLADQVSATVTCRYSGAIQMRSGFDTLLAFTCQECGLGNEVNTTVQ